MISLIFLVVPVALIIKQPDLGTSILVFTASFTVIFLAGIMIGKFYLVVYYLL